MTAIHSTTRIPADSFLTDVSPERYRRWLQLLVDGHQNMVRVWGGGIYETDDFYNICDGMIQFKDPILDLTPHS